MFVILALIAFTLVMFIALRFILPEEEEPDPFSMSMVETGREANETDGNLTDITLWVAVSHGRPRPSWEGMEVRIEMDGGYETLSAPSLAIDDQDGNGRVTEGDLILLRGLGLDLSQGRVVLIKGARTIGSVEL
jgi:hypothetical protein